MNIFPKLKLFFALLVSALLFCSTSYAASNLFELTFDSNSNDPLDHHSLLKMAEGACGTTSIPLEANISGKGTSRGFRYIQCSGRNSNSTPYAKRFGSQESELWVRFYMRYQAGMYFDSFSDDKILEIRSYPLKDRVVVHWQRSGFGMWNNGGNSKNYNGGSWNNVMTGNMQGSYRETDNKWRCYEVYLKKGTQGQNNGVFKAWIDENLVVQAYDVEYGFSQAGWDCVQIGGNQKYLGGNSFQWYQDFDNIAVSTTGYIGPTSGSSSQTPENLRFSDSGQMNVLFTEGFDDNNFSARGWYDNTNIVISNTVHTTNSIGSAEFRFRQGGTSPTSGAAIRRKFTETDEVYVEYYVRYSSNWQGSNTYYHPHEFFLMTNKDGDYTSPNRSHMTAYIEQNEGKPLVAICDGANIDENNIDVDLTNVTESRAVGGCNGNSDEYNTSCYPIGNLHNNWKQWKSDSKLFSDNQGSNYKGDWHCVKAYVKLNSISNGKAVQDGIVRYWYDGNLIIDHTNVVFRTNQNSDMMFNQLLIAPYIGVGSPIDQTFWIDDLTLGT